MATHKRQHYVPRSYLKAWCDPSTPPGQEPYVWLFNKDGSGARRKAPDNIFHERDLYTIHRADGGRDLDLEHGLAELESAFVAIRDTKLAQRKKITGREHLMLCAFIAAAHARTPTQRDHFAGQWAKVLEMMDRMKEWGSTATPDELRRAASFPTRRSGPTFDYDDVRRAVEKPMESMLIPMIEVETRLLMGLDCLVLNNAGPRFVTSDYPCVWFDPEWHKRPPFHQQPALMYKSTEITLPVSPWQMIVLNQHGLTGYFAIPDERFVDEYNRRTRFGCSRYFVSFSNETKPIWFEPGVEPEDSWRKRNPEPPEPRGPWDPAPPHGP